MIANILTNNFYNYMRTQHNIRHAIRGEKPELVKDLASELQPYAQKLTDFEREYAQWALDIYARISIPLLKRHIKEVAKLDRKTKGVMKDFHRKKATRNDIMAVSKEVRMYPATTTEMCTLRAAMRGRVHSKKMTLEEQREWLDDIDIVKHFNLVKEE